MILERIPRRWKRTNRNEALGNTGSELELREELEKNVSQKCQCGAHKDAAECQMEVMERQSRNGAGNRKFWHV